MSDRLSEIKARLESLEPTMWYEGSSYDGDEYSDLAWAVAEIERLCVYEHSHKENTEAASYATQTAIEQSAYIARLEAQLRETLANLYIERHLELGDKGEDYVDAEMAKLREGK